MFGPRDTRALQARRDCKLAVLAAAVIVGYTPNANMADLSVGPVLVARKRG